MAETKSTVKELFPYLRVKGAPAAIDFYKQVFGAVELFRLTEPNGKIGHCELCLGNFIVMVSEEYPEYGCPAPQAPGSSGMAIHLHVDNADAVAERALAAGATMVHELTDQFYGERSCMIRDPFGHEWLIGHEIEKVSPEEMQRRFSALFT